MPSEVLTANTVECRGRTDPLCEYPLDDPVHALIIIHRDASREVCCPFLDQGKQNCLVATTMSDMNTAPCAYTSSQPEPIPGEDSGSTGAGEPGKPTEEPRHEAGWGPDWRPRPRPGEVEGKTMWREPEIQALCRKALVGLLHLTDETEILPEQNEKIEVFSRVKSGVYATKDELLAQFREYGRTGVPPWHPH